MSSSAIPLHRSDLLAWAMLGVWLVGTSLALYWYPSESGQLFEQPDRPFSAPDQLRLEEWFRRTLMGQVSGTKTTVVHLYRAGCACNEAAEAELTTLINRYQGKGVRFLAAPLADSKEESVLGLPQLRADSAPPTVATLKSAPALFIFGADGRLLYYGPYSDSAWCGGLGGQLVVPALDRALIGRESARPIAARGCFCT